MGSSFRQNIIPKTNSRTTATAARRRRWPGRSLPRQGEQKPVTQPRQMARAEILTQLHDTIAACEELFQAHGEACRFELCCLGTNFVGALRVFRMLVEIT